MIVVILMILFFSAPLDAQTAAYPPSAVITGIAWDLPTKRAEAPGSDNWALTWAANGHQYTSFGDGGGFGGTNTDGRTSLGFARVEGDKGNYLGFNVWGGKSPENPAQFGGKSYGIVELNGALYMWRTGSSSDNSAYLNQDLYRSDDLSATWTATGVVFTPSSFPGSDGFFAVTFLQFGQANNAARDGYVYMYAPENKDGVWNVQTPGDITLMRVLAADIEDQTKYAFFSGLVGGNPTWTLDVGSRVPVFQDAQNGVMRTSVIYNVGLQRYILATQQIDRFRSGGGYMGVYDAPEPWGPWTTVWFGDPWAAGVQTGTKTVFWNFSPKWMSANGQEFVLVYSPSDSWTSVEGSFVVAASDTIAPAAPINLRASQ